jgi:hypothetical protein
MALSGIFEPGFSPSRVAEYREELDYIDSASASVPTDRSKS